MVVKEGRRKEYSIVMYFCFLFSLLVGQNLPGNWCFEEFYSL